MCSIFGIAGFEKDKEGRKRLLEEIGVEGETRGSQATGIVSLKENKKVFLQKQSIRALLFNWENIPVDDIAYQGHTRLSTGSPVDWVNNHPHFTSTDDNYIFTVTHNGIIYNDNQLKRKKGLEDNGIKCDSYVINLLLENVMYMQKKNRLDVEVVKEVAELLKGGYAVSILDSEGRIFFFRNNNPINYIKNDEGLVWASTFNMISNAEFVTQTRIEGKIKELPKEKVIEYDVNKNEFVNIVEFEPAQYITRGSWNNYSSTSFNSYNNSKYANFLSEKEQEEIFQEAKEATKKQIEKEKAENGKDLIWYDQLNDKYYYFKNEIEFSNFIHRNVGGELITDQKTLKTLRKRREKKKKQQVKNEDEYTCPDCLTIVPLNMWVQYKNWWECPYCSAVHYEREVTKEYF